MTGDNEEEDIEELFEERLLRQDRRSDKSGWNYRYLHGFRWMISMLI
jgi:hypothetical protein